MREMALARPISPCYTLVFALIEHHDRSPMAMSASRRKPGVNLRLYLTGALGAPELAIGPAVTGARDTPARVLAGGIAGQGTIF